MLNSRLERNISDIKELFGDSSDLNIMRFETAGIRCALITLSGMVDSKAVPTAIFEPLRSIDEILSCEELFDCVAKRMAFSNEQTVINTRNEISDCLCKGFAVLLISGVARAIGISVTGYKTRGIASPDGETNVMGTKESFSDSISVNIAMIRRRVKSPLLRFESVTAGKISETELSLVYMSDKVRDGIVAKVKANLSKIKLDMILTSGCLRPFVAGNKSSVFSSASTTERPDVLIAKINEGRVAILIDGIPHALICPALFIEHFQTVDDYAYKPYYAAYLRWIRYAAFFISALLPGVYVAAATFHPEALSRALLLNLLASEEATPFPLVAEMLLVIVMFEVLREAGLRLPKSIGGAVSIVGGLVIGDAAVTSGIIPAPLLIIIGFTATCSFVVPTLNEQTALLRLVNVILGGTLGFFGISLFCAMILVNACVTDAYATPYLAPVTPFTARAVIRDVVTRRSYIKTQKQRLTLGDLKGTGKEDGD